MHLKKSDIKKVMDALAIKSWGILNLKDSEDGRVVIAAALPYQMEGRLNHPESQMGKIDAFAWEFDYHEAVKRILGQVILHLEDAIGSRFEAPLIYVDQSPYNDQEIGYLAGLGQMGKNHLLINDVYGTHFFIGYMVLSAYVEGLVVTEKPRYHPACLTCERCERACPSQVCTFEHVDMRSCISALTQTKSVLTVDERRLIGRNIYGCSICQKVCPLNENIQVVSEIYSLNTDNWIDAFEILDMNKRMFKDKYGHMGFSWRSLWIYKRNALIILANSGDVNHLLRLEKYAYFTDDENLKATYLWAVETLSKKI